MDNKIYVTKPFLPDKKLLDSYIEKIYDTGIFTNNGPLLKELESKLEMYFHAKHVILVANGTLALQISYRALNLKGEVITTPYSFIATTSSLIWENLTPKFVDIKENNLTIKTENIKNSITERTKGIVPVHVYGFPCEVEEIGDLSKKYGLRVVYDAAHAFNVKYKGKTIVNFGDISIVSFHATKLFNTIEGGAIITNDDELNVKIREMINFGISDDGQIKRIGINAKMNEFEAAVGLTILKDIDKILENRKYTWKYYFNELSKYLYFPEPDNYTEWNYSYVPVLFKNEKQLLEVLKQLNKNRIYPRRYFYPSLNTIPYIKSSSVCNTSEEISKRVLCLPTFYGICDNDLNRIISIIKSSINLKW